MTAKAAQDLIHTTIDFPFSSCRLPPFVAPAPLISEQETGQMAAAWGVDAQRIQDALATGNNIGLENNVPQGGVVWVFAVKK